MTSQKRGKNGVRSVKNEAMLKKGRGGQKRGKTPKKRQRKPTGPHPQMTKNFDLKNLEKTLKF